MNTVGEQQVDIHVGELTNYDTFPGDKTIALLVVGTALKITFIHLKNMAVSQILNNEAVLECQSSTSFTLSKLTVIE